MPVLVSYNATAPSLLDFGSDRDIAHIRDVVENMQVGAKAGCQQLAGEEAHDLRNQSLTIRKQFVRLLLALH